VRAPRLIGPGGRFYADPTPSPDETAFRQDNNSAAYYNSPYYRLHKNQVQPIPPPRPNAPLQLDLTAFLPPAVAAAIDAAGQITFHAVGDTGAAKVTRAQTATIALAHQAAVADAMAKDVAAGGASAPAFFFHLGDLIYNFGEGQYYYDQFYEPYREYDRPIFAVPGNHDGMVFGPTSTAPQVPSLAAFLTNFCAAEPGPSPDAGGLVRSVMTQPGVYFTLDAPFVSIIGLYSNVLDGPGVLSSQGGHFPLVNDQLAFLQSELRRLQPDRLAGHRAVVLAVHHPPLSADVKHGGSTGLQADLDTACQAAGLWPDAVLSGHAHLYQRFTRVVAKGQQTPYVVSGSGGFAVTPPVGTLPPAPVTIGDHTLEIDPILAFGYLTVTVDTDPGLHTVRTLTLRFHAAETTGVTERDAVTVDLRSGKLIAGMTATGGKRGGRPGKKAHSR